MDDRSRLVRHDEPVDPDGPVGGDPDLGDRSDTASLLEADREPEPLSRRATALRPPCGAAGSVENGQQPLVGEVPFPRRERVDAREGGDLVERGLSREVVRVRRERPVRVLGQGRLRELVVDRLVRDVVRGEERGRPGVDVVELPGDEPAVALRADPDVDDRHRAEVAVAELLLPGEEDHHGRLRGPCKARGGEGDRPAVLAPEPRAGVRDDDPHVVDGDAEPLGDRLPRPERRLGPDLDRDPVPVPLGEGRAGLQRDVGDVGGAVRCLEAHGGAVVRRVRLADPVLVAVPGVPGARVRAQVLLDLPLPGLRLELPLGVDLGEGGVGRDGGPRGDADELAVVDHGDPGASAEPTDVDPYETCPVPGRLEVGPESQPRSPEVGDEHPLTRDDLLRGRVDRGLARATPGGRGRERGPRRDRDDNVRCSDEPGVRDPVLLPANADFAVDRLERGRRPEPLLGGPVDQREAGPSRDLAEGRRDIDHRAAPERPDVPGTNVGVRHHQVDALQRNAQLLRDRQGEGDAGPLADLRLPRERPDGTIGADVQPGAPARGRPPATHRRAGRLRRELRHQAVSEESEVLPLLRRRAVPRAPWPGADHAGRPRSRAARSPALRTAARIRVYPQQRQMFPSIAARIAASVGDGFARSRAVALTTIPGVQNPH